MSTPILAATKHDKEREGRPVFASLVGVFAVFDGLFGGVVRRVVAGRARGLVADQLQRLQRVLASDLPQHGSSR